MLAATTGGVLLRGPALAIRHHGVFVKCLDFLDPQCEKGPWDRKAASLKSHMRVHLEQGSNMETSKEMVDAIRSSGVFLESMLHYAAHCKTNTPL